MVSVSEHEKARPLESQMARVLVDSWEAKRELGWERGSARVKEVKMVHVTVAGRAVVRAREWARAALGAP